MNQILSVDRVVLAFNFFNLESVQAIRTAYEGARDQGSGVGVMLACSTSALKYMGDGFVRWVTTGELPVHLDHGANLAQIKHAIDLGFHSVMIDGSHLPFDENVALTRAAVEYAHASGVVVEGELGTIGGVEDDRAADSIIYTKPEDVKKFHELTGVDSLAIAIGTSHGAYKGQGQGQGAGILKFDILREIRALNPTLPLVLHGASSIPKKYTDILGLPNAGGIPESELREAVRLGINKINIDSDARLAFMARLKTEMAANPDKFDPRFFLGKARDEMISYYTSALDLINK